MKQTLSKEVISNDSRELSCEIDSNFLLGKIQTAKELACKIKANSILQKGLAKRVLAMQAYLIKAEIQAKEIQAAYYDMQKIEQRRWVSETKQEYIKFAVGVLGSHDAVNSFLNDYTQEQAYYFLDSIQAMDNEKSKLRIIWKYFDNN